MSSQEELHYEAPQQPLTPETELSHIREQARIQEAQAKDAGLGISREQATSKVLTEYAKQKPEDVLAPESVIEDSQFETIVRGVDALPHREKIRELYFIMQEKGILNAIKVAEGLENPHVEQDFHHVLVHYIHTGGLPPGLDKELEVKAELSHTVYEVIVPLAKEPKEVDPATVLSSMQRFLAGIFGEGAKADAYAFEIALPNFSSSITMYIAVPDAKKDLFLKQFLGNFPTARLTEMRDDYSVFNEYGAIAVAVATHEKRFAYALEVPKDSLESLSPILAAFEKIAHAGEAAAIQYVVRKDDMGLLGKVRGAIGKVRDGMPIYRATDIPLGFGGKAAKLLGKLFESSSKDKPKEVTPEEQERRNREVKVLEDKISAPFVRCDLRVVASAADKERALEIVRSLVAAFGQFTNRESSGGLHFDVFSSGSRTAQTLHAFTYRLSTDDALVLNHNELSGLWHPPLAITNNEAPNLASVKAAVAPPPANLPEEGTIVGDSVFRGERRAVRMTKQDRLRHLYIIGQTGTGKTTISKNMIIEDIRAGEGCCFIDPHGSDVQDILANIPKERIDDVIYFDPSYMERPFGLNLMEYDQNKPEQKIFLVNEMFAIFRKLYSNSPESMGPAFEQYFRNATMLVMEDPETGCTMLEIVRVMADAKFRELKLTRCKNPIVVQFWREIAAKTTGETGLQNMIPYITNKFDVFLSNDIMRPIIAQEKSSFDFRKVMDEKKILLVNLAKGKLGEMNANLLGMIIVGRIFLAAMSRVDSYGAKLPDFYLYIDEFQNISTPSIAGILSEARKYGLSLNIAHQYIAQIDDDIKDAVFGNVGTMAVFRVGAEDAEFLEKYFAPTFEAKDMAKIESYNCYFKPLIDGKPVTPFNLSVRPPEKGVKEIVPQLMQLSFLKYGRDRKTVDDVIIKKYQSTSSANQAAAQKQTPPSAPTIPRPSPLSAGVPVANPGLAQRVTANTPIDIATFTPSQYAPAAQTPPRSSPQPYAPQYTPQPPQQYAPQYMPQPLSMAPNLPQGVVYGAPQVPQYMPASPAPSMPPVAPMMHPPQSPDIAYAEQYGGFVQHAAPAQRMPAPTPMPQYAFPHVMPQPLHTQQQQGFPQGSPPPLPYAQPMPAPHVRQGYPQYPQPLPQYMPPQQSAYPPQQYVAQPTMPAQYVQSPQAPGDPYRESV